MAEETAVAAPSAVEAEDVFRGETPTLAEYARYRTDGELPERFKQADTPAEAAPATSEGDEPESVPEAEPEEQQQEKPKHGKLSAEDRIAQLEATIAKIKRGAGLERKTEVAPVNQPQPQAQPTQQQYAHPKPTVEDKNPDGTAKYATYEDYVESLGRWAAKEERSTWERENAVRQQQREISEKIAEARERYEDFDEVAIPAITKVVGSQSVSPAAKAMLNDSDVLPDLAYVIGGDAQTLEDFLKMPPGKQLRYIAVTEALIKGELGDDEPETQAGAKPPAKPQTAAPKPPSPVGGASSRAFDVSDESLSPEEWMRKRNADLERKRKA
jgi:hypothetical protein